MFHSVQIYINVFILKYMYYIFKYDSNQAKQDDALFQNRIYIPDLSDLYIYINLPFFIAVKKYI